MKKFITVFFISLSALTVLAVFTACGKKPETEPVFTFDIKMDSDINVIESTFEEQYPTLPDFILDKYRDGKFDGSITFDAGLSDRTDGYSVSLTQEENEFVDTGEYNKHFRIMMKDTSLIEFETEIKVKINIQTPTVLVSEEFDFIVIKQPVALQTLAVTQPNILYYDVKNDSAVSFDSVPYPGNASYRAFPYVEWAVAYVIIDGEKVFDGLSTYAVISTDGGLQTHNEQLSFTDKIGIYVRSNKEDVVSEVFEVEFHKKRVESFILVYNSSSYTSFNGTRYDGNEHIVNDDGEVTSYGTGYFHYEAGYNETLRISVAASPDDATFRFNPIFEIKNHEFCPFVRLETDEDGTIDEYDAIFSFDMDTYSLENIYFTITLDGVVQNYTIILF